jgi:hypothetical protein
LPGFATDPRILDHPLFRGGFSKFVHVEKYDRDGGHSHPRFRFEFNPDTPDDVERAALEIECACCRCGHTIRPFRRRKTKGPGLGRLYLAVACPHAVDQGCARSRVAAQTYTAIAAALGHKR